LQCRQKVTLAGGRSVVAIDIVSHALSESEPNKHRTGGEHDSRQRRSTVSANQESGESENGAGGTRTTRL
jgi:hypothetical protein